MKKLIAIIALFAASFAYAEQQPLEPLYGHFKTAQGVAIQVYSGGCTTKESFDIQKNVVRGVIEVSFVRTRPDYCEAFFKYGRMVYFTYEEMGLELGDSYQLMNPEISVHVVR